MKKNVGEENIQEYEKAWELLVSLPEFLEDLKIVKISADKILKREDFKTSEEYWDFLESCSTPEMEQFEIVWGFWPSDCLGLLNNPKAKIHSINFHSYFPLYKKGVAQWYSQNDPWNGIINWMVPEEGEENFEQNRSESDKNINFQSYKIEIDLTMPTELLLQNFERGLSHYKRYFNIKAKNHPKPEHDEYIVQCLSRRGVSNKRIYEIFTPPELLEEKYHYGMRESKRNRIKALLSKCKASQKSL